ncbi:MAG: shikimate dehydrogenase [Lautropia sp.]|nr:shikimate dehydrogenase [Lautropia sp.]
MITGNTRLIAHIGYPTSTFRSPMIYNPWFHHVGLDVVVVPFASGPDGYPTLLRSLFNAENMVGALVTMPHKIVTASLVDRLSVAAGIAGACNAVRRAAGGGLEGDLFDGEGFVLGMQRRGINAGQKAALVIGCGGVGSAISASLAGAGIAHLGLYDIRDVVMQDLAVRLQRYYPALDIRLGSADPAGFDIVINASPLGMQPSDPLPVDVSRIEAHAYVGEVVLKEENTRFMVAARARGCLVQGGLDMLYEQIPAYLNYFGLPVATPAQLRSLSCPMG